MIEGDFNWNSVTFRALLQILHLLIMPIRLFWTLWNHCCLFSRIAIQKCHSRFRSKLMVFLFWKVYIYFLFILINRCRISIIELFMSCVTEVECVEGLTLWRRDSSTINREIYSGFKQSNPNKDINEYFAGCCLIFSIDSFNCFSYNFFRNAWNSAYDFLNTNGNIFNVTLWHNGTSNDNKKSLSRILRALNAVRITDWFLTVVKSKRRVK